MKPRLPQWIGGRKKDTEKNGLGLSGFDLYRTALGVCTAVVLSVLLCSHLLPAKVSLKIGDVATDDIRAHRTVTYRDTAETERLRQAAAAKIGDVYSDKSGAVNDALEELNDAFNAVKEAMRNRPSSEPDAKARYVRSLIRTDLSHSTLRILVSASDRDLMSIEELAQQLVSQEFSREIRSDKNDLLKARADIDSRARRLLGETPQASALAEVAGTVMRPNKMYDQDATRARKLRAEKSVEPVQGQTVIGALVIAKGEKVRQTHIDKFRALGLTHPKIDYTTASALSLFVVLLTVLVAVYLRRYQPEIHEDIRKLALLSLVVVLSMVGLKVGGAMIGLNLSGLQLGYLGMMTVTTAGMLLAALLNPSLSVVIVSVLSIASGLTMNNELRFAAVTLVSSLVAIYSVANIRYMGDLMRTISAIALTDVAMVWIVGSMSGDTATEMMTGSGWVVIMAAAATMLFWVGTGILERLFGITTHITLLELSDTNKPLLRRLVMEAPGTYTHSLATGHLAEAAAEAVHADSLFARVASYYHDIGKIRRPHFFVENQGVENAHDKLSPTLSSLVITSHIKDGLEIAKEYRLPPAFQEVILQHHGTSLVTYFYNQVAESEECSAALERQFRYSGPKPRTKEAAIVMLADAVEAASRSLAKPTPARLESLVQKVIDDKLRDGQLEQSDLTFRDIATIEDSFARSLSATLHARIEYPDVITVDGKKLITNGDTDTERIPTLGTGKSEPPAEGHAKITAG
ncbi:MAG: HDIG domain-containing protein [Armatimonadota bacterium]|nr:HDIG domain-containing protein [Armatimonadota bacterium]